MTARWDVFDDRQMGHFGDRQMGRFQWLLTIKGISILPNIVAEEKMRWIAIREIISDELTPFAKQGFLNGLYTQNG